MSDSTLSFYKKAPPDRGASSFLYPPTDANIRFFAEALRAGCLVAIPTETVYGLAGLALDPRACRAIFTLKGRPLIDPLIVHVGHEGHLDSLAEVTPEARKLIAAFWPGPLTLVLKKKPAVPDIVTAGKSTVAIRMPRHRVARQLLAEVDAPLAAPSANPFGYISPSRAAHVADSFGEKVPYILDGGESDIGLESTILDLSIPSCAQVLRPGAISAGQIEDILKIPVTYHSTDPNDEGAPIAPGMLASHYSPRTPLDLFSSGAEFEDNPGEAIILLKAPGKDRPRENLYWLSENGASREIAKNLFALLRQVDQAGYQRIHCEMPTEANDGLLMAIRDRLVRAAK